MPTPGDLDVPQPVRPNLRGRRLDSGLSVLSKRSLASHATSSFEADDERSSTDGDMTDRSSDPGAPRYTGYDARPTSRKELLGWYMYAFAAETYVICGIGEHSPALPALAPAPPG